jgi:predicted amino acid-binding ACT domain protein
LHGSDHPGIISAVTRVLSANNINIRDLATRVISGERSIFLMTIDLIVPAEVDVLKVTESLRNIGNDIECEIIFTGDDSITC